MSGEQAWMEGKTPNEIAQLEERGKAVVAHLEFLDQHPKILPSPEEATEGLILHKLVRPREPGTEQDQ